MCVKPNRALSYCKISLSAISGGKAANKGDGYNLLKRMALTVTITNSHNQKRVFFVSSADNTGYLRITAFIKHGRESSSKKVRFLWC